MNESMIVISKEIIWLNESSAGNRYKRSDLILVKMLPDYSELM